MLGSHDIPLVALSVIVAIGASLAALRLGRRGARVSAGEALRESEERYRSLVSDIDEVIFRMDALGRWTFLNAAWTNITGFTPQATIGKKLIDSVHPDDHPALLAQWQSFVNGKADYSRLETRCLTSNGDARWVEVYARAARNESRDMVGATGVIRDVTERRRAEEALRAARETAEAASRAKSEFLSRMSHELRTPLNAILGFGQLMELDANTPDQQENATQILKAGHHLLSLINEVLDITGIESGRLPVSAEPVHLAEVIDEVARLMEPLAAQRRIQLRVEASSHAAEYVQADRQRLKQILLNLVANAVKYNREAGVARIVTELSGNGRLRVMVADTGYGIPADKLSRLFTPFDRLGHDSTVEGTGLGLALSKRLVEAMDGVMGVETAEGSGSTFWIELPRAESQLAVLDKIEDLTPTSMAAVPQVLRRRGKILYVEDNLSNLALMQRIVARNKRIELIPAMSGGHALGLARLRRPDLILLDLHLPDVAGEEVLRQLRSDPVCGDVPVVILTADATPGKGDELLGAGAHAFFTKPLDLAPFVTLLNDVLELEEAA